MRTWKKPKRKKNSKSLMSANTAVAFASVSSIIQPLWNAVTAFALSVFNSKLARTTVRKELQVEAKRRRKQPRIMGTKAVHTASRKSRKTLKSTKN
jgi:hypothetical protein